MKRQSLLLEATRSRGFYRTLIKTTHGRKIYLEIRICDDYIHIEDCFYYDRKAGRLERKSNLPRPLKLKTLCMPFTEGALLHMIGEELDRKFFELEIIENPPTIDMHYQEYLDFHERKSVARYHFLIMVRDGTDTPYGLPATLRTRLKNKLHRAIYLELEHYKNDMGVVKSCHYYDRKYMDDDRKVSPPSLFTCFFHYNEGEILKLVNCELECNFTHILIADGHNLDVIENVQPLCGNI